MKRFWQDRPTFVTGGTGLLGSWLVKALLEQGADIVCLMRDWVPQSELVRSKMIDSVKVVRGDIEDQQLMERIMGEYEIDTVFHLAAQTIVQVANKNPISTFNSNIGGTISVLEAARHSSTVKQIVVASSDKAYGEQTILPYTEETPLAGQHPYDVSKSCADLISQSYAKTYDSPVCVTRCGNFYGGGDLNWNRIVPGTIRSVIRNEAPVIRSNGKFVRDYFYIEDGASAYMQLAEKMSLDTSLHGEAFNFSTDTPLSVVEIVNTILENMNASFKPEILNQASNEIEKQYLSSKKARSVLGWSPLYAFDEGIRKTVEWYQNFFKG